MLEPLVIDSRRFAEFREHIKLKVAVADFTRLSGALMKADGELIFSLYGLEIERETVGLELKLNCTLQLACQRCLGIIRFPIQHVRRFCLSANVPENVADEDAEIDFLPADRKLDVLELVEEEALLCLPLAPMHEIGQCEEMSGAQRMREQIWPFAELHKLKL